MTKRLTIDRGNTAVKVALWEFDRICDSVELSSHADMQTVLERLGIINDFSPFVSYPIGYCSVVPETYSRDMQILRHFGRVYDVKSPDTRLPFVNAYGTPETLGADRIAAIAGAMEHLGGSSALVADLGTAATFDLLEATPGGPVYRGGNISPGVPMRLCSLHEHTSALPAVSPELVPDSFWGHSTPSALLNGAVFGILAELEFHRAHAPEGCATVLTGGGADYLVRNNLISFKHIHDPQLVLRGLNTIINYNENR